MTRQSGARSGFSAMTMSRVDSAEGGGSSAEAGLNATVVMRQCAAGASSSVCVCNVAAGHGPTQPLSEVTPGRQPRTRPRTERLRQ